MTKPPTAEEVLGLYQKWKATAKDFYQKTGIRQEEVTGFAMDVIRDKEKFNVALAFWQAAQGPVTREWFEERFSSCVIICRNGVIYDPRDDGTVVMEVEDSYGQVTVDLVNPTRSKIEALVEMLGGDACG